MKARHTKIVVAGCTLLAAMGGIAQSAQAQWGGFSVDVGTSAHQLVQPDRDAYAQATSASQSQDGSITLDGGSEGTVQVAGTLDASGKSAGETGGTVDVTGHDVQLVSTAKIDVSGDTGGGTALVGGDMHGSGPLRDASTTSVASGAAINADAGSKGNGGEVVVWSNEQTDYEGTISAKGGAMSGNGGSAEISSHGLLNFNGFVDLQAPKGAVGSLFLDPENVTIAQSGSSPTLPSSQNAPLEFDPSGDNSVLSVSTLQNALALADVTVSTGSGGSQAGDITVASTLSWASNYSLTLSAYRNITINDSVVIANTGAGNLILRADNTGTGVGTVIFNGVARVDYGGSTGTVSIFYNPSDNPAGSGVNATSYTSPTDFSSYVLTNESVSNQFTPYMLVNTVYDLQNIENNLSGDYALGKDIDTNNASSFAPIGSASDPFLGTLTGEERTISNLTIKDSTDQYVGLFGDIGASGIVKSLTLANTSVAQAPFPLVANAGRGILAGQNSGLIESVTLTGADDGLVGINSGAITQVAVSGLTINLSDNGLAIGGISGANTNTITNSSVSGTITSTGTDTRIGGLVGYNTGTISLSFSDVSIIGNGILGGLVGYNKGAITQSYATGATEGGDNSFVGGLVGWNDFDSFQTGTISQSYTTGVVVGGGTTTQLGDCCSYPPQVQAQVGGLVGLNGGTIASSYASNSVQGGSGYGTFVGGLVGGNWGNVSQSFATGSVSGGDDSWIGGLVGSDWYSSLTKVYATGSVTGGQGAAAGGLVGSANDDNIFQAYAMGNVTVKGGCCIGGAGGFVGYSAGLISDAYATGAVSISSAGSEAGGFVGVNIYGAILNAYTISGMSGKPTLGAFAGSDAAPPLGATYAFTNTYFDTDISSGFPAVGIRLLIAKCDERIARLTDALVDGLIDKATFDARKTTVLKDKRGYPARGAGERGHADFISRGAGGRADLGEGISAGIRCGRPAQPTKLWHLPEADDRWGTERAVFRAHHHALGLLEVGCSRREWFLDLNPHYSHPTTA